MKLLLTCIFLAVASTHAAAACTAEHATYKLIEDARFSLVFSNQKNPKAWSNIEATLKTPYRQLHFEFTAANGYPMNYLELLDKVPKQDKSIDIAFFDHALKTLGLPEAGDPAPTFLFSPQLGLWLNYAGLNPNEYLPPGMWKLAACKS
jgi:hypothetical protein